jgi:6,7-dimethyl-8-ribityllumazine synthase
MSELQQHSDLAADAAAGLRFALLVSRFNEDITAALRDAALQTLAAHGADGERVRVHPVPGAFELPMTAARLADGRVDAIICLGALIRGETPHFEYLSQAVAQGIEQVAVRSGVPVIFGVLTCDTRAHALARAGGDRGNKGAEAALAAIEMALLFAALQREG